MNPDTLAKKKISAYKTRGNLAHTARVVLQILGQNHEDVKMHSVRVALLSEATAVKLGRDKPAHFFSGLLHDAGKPLLPFKLFDGHNINSKEYEMVKTHALSGFEVLKDFHLFCAVVAGIHHNVYQNGYGLEAVNFPTRWGVVTIKKAIDTAVVVSIADFVDAATHRQTKIKNGTRESSLRKMLYGKYEGDRYIVDLVLEANQELTL